MQGRQPVPDESFNAMFKRAGHGTIKKGLLDGQAFVVSVLYPGI